MVSSGIYTITNKVTGKQYVGSAVNIYARWSVHKHNLSRGDHHSSKLQRSWNKYGTDAFSFDVMLLCDKHNLIFYEQRIIDEFGSYLSGYNSNPIAGNSLGYKHREDSLKKMSLASIGRKNQYARGAVMSDETKNKISQSNSERIVSEETKKKLRFARIGRKPSLGMKHSDEVKRKMSDSRKGRPITQKVLDALNRTGIKHSEETRKKIGERSGASRLGKPRGPYCCNKMRRVQNG